MNNFAPVLICTLNRHEHFSRCVKSLAKCLYSDKTELYIALDYPSNQAQLDGYTKINAFLPKIKGFKNIIIIKRTKNLGAEQNYLEAQKEIFLNNDRIIISEDDNVFAPSFLEFVNTGLCVYENRPDIYSISGYNSPFTMPSWYKYDIYLRTGFTGWGVGGWRDKWNKVDRSSEYYNSILCNKENYKKLKRNYQIYLPQLLKIRDTGIITGDGLLFLYLLDKNMYSVYPVKTRVKNNGHDGSGENCGYNEKYLNQKVYNGAEDVCFPFDLQPNEELAKYIIKQLQPPFIEKIRLKIPSPVRMLLKRIIKKV